MGDDLALNAEQVAGVRTNRELPVVWAVAKGSLLNKLILVPSALAVSYFIPFLINIFLIIGGLYLCYEGYEKVVHKLLSSKQHLSKHDDINMEELSKPGLDIRAFEKAKIRGAIRTDFVLSAEIVVIILGTIQNTNFFTQVSILSLLAVSFTVGVYGSVALIVKLEDIGLYLLRKSSSGNFDAIQRHIGRGLLTFAPILMKLLSFIGTIAMFLVGGGIIVHGIPLFHHILDHYVAIAEALPNFSSIASSITSITLNATIGILSGIAMILIVSAYKKVKAITQ